VEMRISVKRRKIIISYFIVILAFIVSGVYQLLSNSKYGTYENKGKVDPDIYYSKIKSLAIGKTTNGEFIFELKDDPSHKKLIFLPDNMSSMYLFSK
jgi:hypothetical protein